MQDPRNKPDLSHGPPNGQPFPKMAAFALALAAFLAFGLALFALSGAPASAEETPQKAQPDESDGSDDPSKGSGGGLGVIVDIPEGWPMKGGDGDIVRFEECFPFCNTARPGEGSSGGDGGGPDDGETVIEGTTSEQTNIIEETQIEEGTTSEDTGGEDGDSGSGGEDPESTTDEPEDAPTYTTPEPTMEETTPEPTSPEDTISDEGYVPLPEATQPEGTTGPSAQTECPTGPSGPISEVKLTKVLDADTLEVEGSDGNSYTIRLIGAEAPDLAEGGAAGEDEPGAKEAAAAAEELLGGQGQTLNLEYDQEQTDENGQTFAYVWTESSEGGPELFNAQLVRSGYARAAAVEPNTDYAACLEQAEEQARDDGSGLWEQASSGGDPGSPQQASSAYADKASANAGAVGGVAVELVSRRAEAPRGESAASGNGSGSPGIPPITGHAEPPAPATEVAAARAAHPVFALGLGVALLAAVLAVSRRVRQPGAPAILPGGERSQS